MENYELREHVERAIAGDQTALSRLLLANYESLHAHLAAQMSPEIQASHGVDDLVQQVYAQAFRDIARFVWRGESSLPAWLKTIADHRLRDALRAHRCKKRGGDFYRIPVHADNDSRNVTELLEALAVTTDTPSRDAARHEAVDAIQAALSVLPDEYRRVIQLRYFDGLPIEVIARVVGKSTGAVRGLLERGKQRMRDALLSASCYLSSG